MTQLGLELELSTKRTRKREFLEEIRRVVPWSKLIRSKPAIEVAAGLHVWMRHAQQTADSQEMGCADLL